MKRLLCGLLVFVCLVCFSSCGSNPSDSISIPDTPVQTDSDGNVVEKDSNGHITKLFHYDGDKKLVFVHEQVWENDRIVKKTSYDSTGKKTASFDYSYDERGNNTESTWFFWNSGILMKVETRFDEYNRKTETTSLGSGSVVTNKTYFEYADTENEHPTQYVKTVYYPEYPGSRYSVDNFEYDSDGNKIKKTTFNQDNVLIGYVEYINENGLCVEETKYDASDKIEYKYKYFYDNTGKLTREERYDADGKLTGVDNY